MGRGDVVRFGSSLLLVDYAPRGRFVYGYRLVAQSRPRTRDDYRISTGDRAALGLPGRRAWLVALRPVRETRSAVTQKCGVATATMMADIRRQLVHADASARQESGTWRLR